jgi:membrane-associated phospholipid phosphatase
MKTRNAARTTEADIKNRIPIVTAIWIVAFIVALVVDTPVATRVHTSGTCSYIQHAVWPSNYSIGRRHLPAWPAILKAPGVFWTTVAVVSLLAILRQINGKQCVFVLLAGVMSGLNSPIKWIVGRYRPYKSPGPVQPNPFHIEPFWHGLHGLLKQGPLSFPSGHESTAFALATALLLVWPRGGWVFVLLALVTGLERICENAHYCSDVVGAIGFAMLGVLLLNRLLKDWSRASHEATFLPHHAAFDPSSPT